MPEKWFQGRRLRTPGLTRRARVDWLYSARGVSMEGDGIGLDGKRYHIDSLGSAGWINKLGRATSPGGERLEQRRAVVAQRPHLVQPQRPADLPALGRRLVSRDARAATCPTRASASRPGPRPTSRTGRASRSTPTSSRWAASIYVPAYKSINGGWFVAADVGGAVSGKHIDVFRPPPSKPFGDGRYLQDQRMLVVPPGRRMSSTAPAPVRCRGGWAS